MLPPFEKWPSIQRLSSETTSKYQQKQEQEPKP